MGNIIGEPLDGYVTNQIKARQTLHGSGVRFNFNERTSDQINILNSNTAWVKLASGIFITPERSQKDGFRSGLTGTTPSERFILFGGVYWSKFAHMFYKPGAAIQKNLAEADGSRDNLPPPADAPEQFGLGIKREQPKHY